MPIIAYALPISPINPSGTTLPATCRTGSLFIDTDADTDGALYQCVATDTWKIVSGSGVGTVDTSGTPVANDIARFTDDDTIEGRSYAEFISDLALAAINAAATVTGEWELPYKNYTVWSAAPTGADKVVGRDYLADGVTWNPCGLDVAIPYWVTLTDDDPSDVYVVYRDTGGKAYFSTIQAAMKVIPDADGITLTAAQMNAVIVATNASEVQIPADQCDTVTGKWVTVKQTGAYAVDIAVLDAADDIYMLDGTKIEGTTHEIQTAGASGNQITLMCIAVNEWWVTGEIGTSTSEAAD